MCFEFDARPPALPDDLRLPVMAGGAAAERLTLTSADGTEFGAALAQSPAATDPAVVVLPDVRGLYRFYIELAEQLAEAGHHTIVLDYFGRTAGIGERREDFDFMAHIPEAPPETVQLDIAAAVEALRERTGATRFVSVGFCFGGANSYLAGTNPDTGLDAVIGFYGTLRGDRIGPGFPSPMERAAEIRVPTLAMFGGGDPLIPEEDRTEFDRLLDDAGVEHEVIAYPDAPHSFFDRSQDEWEDASADAWRRMLDFLNRQGAVGAA